MTVIHLLGAVDMLHAPGVLRDVDREIERGATDITFDFAGLTFIDTMGIGVIVHAYKRVPVSLVNVSDYHRRTLACVGLDPLIEGAT